MSSPVLIKPFRSLDGLIADTVLEERHEDRTVATDHPVEQGSTITDHIYKLPAELTLVYVWSLGSVQNNSGDPSFLRAMYAKLLQLQVDRTLFQVFTGKRIYQNMYMQSVGVLTDNRSENILRVHAICREVILVTTQTVQFTDAAVQTLPQRTANTVPQGQQNLNPGTNFNSNAFGKVPQP